ncbi:MAG: hypothetical protein AB1453_16560, partial [Chloroflexota bacterium]
MPHDIVHTLREVFQVTDPAQPLASGDPRYVICSDVRGSEDAVDYLFNTIAWQQEGAFSYQLFSGHRGCGKSTELLRLKARLEEAGYVVVYYESQSDLDLNDVNYSDIILSIVRRVTGDLAQRGVKLDNQLLDEVEVWFAETLYTKDQWRELQRTLEAETALGVDTAPQLPIVVRLLARLMGQIKSGEQVKNTIRGKLDPQISQLIARANLLLTEARRQLKQPLAILVDDLDKINLQDIAPGRTSHDAIYIDHGDQLCSLAAHIIYTIPISMLYSVSAPALRSNFPERAVLPMIKSHERDGNLYQPGMDKLREILACRIDLDKIFTPDAVEHLCRMCGGHPRDLMTLVRYTTRYPQNRWPRPLDLESAQRAVGRLITEYSRAIPEDFYPWLAQISLNKSIRNDNIHSKMLYYTMAMEYYNGQTPWYDVHPAVQELPKFQTALIQERKKHGVAAKRSQ